MEYISYNQRLEQSFKSVKPMFPFERLFLVPDQPPKCNNHVHVVRFSEFINTRAVLTVFSNFSTFRQSTVPSPHHFPVLPHETSFSVEQNPELFLTIPFSVPCVFVSKYSSWIFLCRDASLFGGTQKQANIFLIRHLSHILLSVFPGHICWSFHWMLAFYNYAI